MHNDLLETLPSALVRVGIKTGDVVLIHSDMRALGMPASISDAKEILPFYLKTLQEAVGQGGTLAVPAYFYEYARYGTPFDTETSPVSLSLGSFSRYVASLPDRVRSCNPLQSIAAIGARAHELAGDDSLSGYGVTSPWHRLRMMGGKILFIGVTIQPMTYVHYIEQQYGVPHMYCKVFQTPVLRAGKQIFGSPVSSVRYLDFDIEYDLNNFETKLIQHKQLEIATVGQGTLRCATAQDVFNTGIQCLDANPYFFLKHPPAFVPGKIPCDGATAPKN
ncbi:MAG: AAC(3) family N-acetyltransferase [Parachlamydiaceae bacterium]|nr:AAC(3) family N-acetyltransferase [Parachlamydiaceae bacterium]